MVIYQHSKTVFATYLDTVFVASVGEIVAHADADSNKQSSAVAVRLISSATICSPFPIGNLAARGVLHMEVD